MSAPEGRTLWERVGEGLQEWYVGAVGWTGEKARIGVKKMDILGIQHNVKRSMTHLGGRVYDLMQRGLPIESDEQVQEIVRGLRGFEEELAAREREIDMLRSSRRSPEEATAGATARDTSHDASDETVAADATGSTGADPDSGSAKP